MKIVPGKMTPAGPQAAALAERDLIMYEHDGAALLGTILAFRKQKYLVLNERGREIDLPSTRLYGLPGTMPIEAATNERRAAFLTELRGEATQLAANIKLDELWQVIKDDDRTFSPQMLCELYFSDDSLLHHLAMRIALLDDKTYFKRSRDDFIPRPTETVEQLLRAIAAKQEKERIQTLAIQAFRQRLQDRSSTLPEESAEILRLLRETAAGANLEVSRQKEAKAILETCCQELQLESRGTREQQAYALLEQLGIFGPDENLSIIRHGLETGFSEYIMQAAQQLHVPLRLEDCMAEDRSIRKDLTHLEAFTIDDKTTRDMDDALSLEVLDDGFRVGVHVSDVACAIPADSPLDRDARARATSLYLPERVIHMLPEPLSTDKLSLRTGTVRPCISCLFEFDRNLRIRAQDIVASLVRIARRFDYEEVDALLEQQSHRELNTLYEIAVNHETERINCGAQKVFKHDLVVVLKEDGDFELVEIDEHGPARSLVGEMMVMSNIALAQYAIRHSLPMVYRLQEAPAEDVPTDAPEGPASLYQQRARLKKSATAVTPGRHSSLGVDAYVQATSPIRRYIDLCNQRQILGHLRTGRPFYSAAELENAIQQTEEPLAAALAVTRETKRYWLLKYLKRRTIHVGPAESKNRIKATVLRSDLKNPLVELDEIFLPTLVKLGRPVKPGDELLLRAVVVDPRTDYLRLEEVS